MQFIGRFHPLAVHLPIALVLLVPILELAGRDQRFAYLRASAPFVLSLAIITGIAASFLGWCLARNGGYAGPLVTQHMWSAFWLVTLSSLCWILRGRGGRSERIYPVALAACLVSVALTGYRGGQLSLGENHLTEFMPAGLRSLLGVTLSSPLDSAPDPNTFYGARIHPIFAGNCLTCHGPDKHKADLRMDSYAALMRGGKHGVVVKAGDLQGSELFRRITLPSSHDDFMPKEGKRPLSQDQVKLIELWIAAGASGTQLIDAIKGAPADSQSALAIAEVRFPEIDFTGVSKRRAELAPTLEKLQKRFPGTLNYESRGSTDFVLNASLMGQSFGDEELASLAPLAENIVFADLSRTAITDHSAPTISAMRRLRVLRLMHTKIGDGIVRSLENLDQLESLSIFDTAVTPAALPSLVRLQKLQHVYAGRTGIKSGVNIPESLKDKVLF